MEILNQILNEVGEDVINVYRRKLYENNVNATGSLSSTLSCFVQVEKDTYDLYIRIQDYWKYIEYGRKPGTFPNIDAIKRWIRIKPVQSKIRNINNLAYLLANSIKKKGIEPKPLLKETLASINFADAEDRITNTVSRNVDLIINTLK